jgi:hypothetical protein
VGSLPESSAALRRVSRACLRCLEAGKHDRVPRGSAPVLALAEALATLGVLALVLPRLPPPTLFFLGSGFGAAGAFGCCGATVGRSAGGDAAAATGSRAPAGGAVTASQRQLLHAERAGQLP